MNNRIEAIADAATILFLRQGYSKTQISHIAKASGVSVGAIYLDFAGKKEIMHFILKSTIDPDFINSCFKRPITDDIFVGIEDDIVALFDRVGKDFSKHIKNKAEDYSFEELISDSFDILSQYAAGCLFIEKNYFDFNYLSEHYLKYRKAFFDTMSMYLSLFIEQGSVRPLEHLDLTCTLIIEILSWWAMDMRYTSFETCDIPVELAKKVCMDNIISAYKQ